MHFIAITPLYTLSFTVLFTLFFIIPTTESFASAVALRALDDLQRPALTKGRQSPPRQRYFDDEDCPDPERNFHYLNHFMANDYGRDDESVHRFYFHANCYANQAQNGTVTADDPCILRDFIEQLEDTVRSLPIVNNTAPLSTLLEQVFDALPSILEDLGLC